MSGAEEISLKNISIGKKVIQNWSTLPDY